MPSHFSVRTHAQPSWIPEKENLYSQGKIDQVTNKQRSGKSRWVAGVDGETTAIKFVPADNIDGKADNEGQEHRINDQCSRAGIKADDQCQPRNEFDEGYDDGEQIDEHGREKIVPVDYFSEDRRCQDLAITGIDKGRAEKTTCGQFGPAVA